MVQSRFIERGSTTGKYIKVRCIHGDIRTYPTTDVELQLAGKTYIVRDGVSETLPKDVILGMDVPDLVELLHS